MGGVSFHSLTSSRMAGCDVGFFWGKGGSGPCEYALCPAGTQYNDDASSQPTYSYAGRWPSECPCVVSPPAPPLSPTPLPPPPVPPPSKEAAEVTRPPPPRQATMEEFVNDNYLGERIIFLGATISGGSCDDWSGTGFLRGPSGKVSDCDPAREPSLTFKVESDGAKSVEMRSDRVRQNGQRGTFPDNCVNYASCYRAAIETASYSLYRGGSFVVTFKAQLSRDETR